MQYHMVLALNSDSRIIKNSILSVSNNHNALVNLTIKCIQAIARFFAQFC